MFTQTSFKDMLAITPPPLSLAKIPRASTKSKRIPGPKLKENTKFPSHKYLCTALHDQDMTNLQIDLNTTNIIPT